MAIEFSEAVINELQGLKFYYQEQKAPHVSNNFVSDIINHLETLPANPKVVSGTIR